MKVQYSDEAIVVRNPQPMKVSNDKEGNTRGTSFTVMMAGATQKDVSDAKGGRDFKEYSKAEEGKAKVLKDS